MRAARFLGARGGLVLQDVEVPEPDADEVRVAVGACGLCGSDLHILDGVTATAAPPLTLGHEAAGVVDKVGAGADPSLVGRQVAVAAGYGCGRCPACRRGEENICPQLQIPGITRDGAFAAFVCVPQRCVVPVDASVDVAVAAILTDAVATPFHAIRRSGVGAGDLVAVFGIGGLGAPAVLLLTQVVGARVIAVDARPAALRFASALGASQTVLAGDVDGATASRAVRAASDGGVDAAFEFVGAAAVVDQAVKSLRPGGTCTVVGVGRDRLTLGIRQETLVAGELRLQGSFGSTAEELGELAALVASGRLDVSAVVTHRYPLAQVDEAVATLRGGEALRVVLRP